MSKFTQAVESMLDGLTAVGIGIIESCPECENCSDEGSFSWQSCDVCGSSLGGDRHVGHGYSGENLIHFDMCVDCLMYLANGEEPEIWEG
jgi:hypothetical protein